MPDLILLISGNSSRMGKEKAFLPFSNNLSFLEHILKCYSGFLKGNIFFVLNSRNYKAIEQKVSHYTAQLVRNDDTEKGRFHSIQLGIDKSTSSDGVFIQNIDNPFVNKSLLKGMSSLYEPNAFVVPQFQNKNGHPLLLGNELVRELKENAAAYSDFKIFLNQYEKRFFVSEQESVLANINSQQEYQKWFPQMR